MAQNRNSIVSLSLAFLVCGLLGCSRQSQGEANATAAPAGAKPAAPAATPAPTSPSPGAAAGAAPAAPEFPEAKLPAVVAQAGGKQLKKEDLLKRAKEMQTQLARMGRQEPLSAPFYRQVAEGILMESLLQDDIAAAGIKVTDAEVNEQFAALKKNFPDDAAYKKTLEAQGMQEAELLRQLREKIAVQKYVTEKIVPQVQITDEAVKKFYDENQARMRKPERVHARHILIRTQPTDAEADKKKAKDKAEALLARIKKGEDFAKLATENSDDPGTKPNGGDLSWITKGQTVEPFEKAAFALKANEVSPVVETEFGYHIIQSLEHQPESTVPFEEAKERIAAFLKQRDTDTKMREHVVELRGKAKVEIFIPEAPAATATPK
jgi:peptidyl-prolyl cis-trans isomerase C